MVSFFVVSLIMLAESLIIVELESVLIAEVVSVTVVDVSLVSVLLLEQAVASTIIDNRKKADFAMIAGDLIS